MTFSLDNIDIRESAGTPISSDKIIATSNPVREAVEAAKQAALEIALKLPPFMVLFEAAQSKEGLALALAANAAAGLADAYNTEIASPQEHLARGALRGLQNLVIVSGIYALNLVNNVIIKSSAIPDNFDLGLYFGSVAVTSAIIARGSIFELLGRQAQQSIEENSFPNEGLNMKMKERKKLAKAKKDFDSGLPITKEDQRYFKELREIAIRKLGGSKNRDQALDESFKDFLDENPTYRISETGELQIDSFRGLMSVMAMRMRLFPVKIHPVDPGVVNQVLNYEQNEYLQVRLSPFEKFQPEYNQGPIEEAIIDIYFDRGYEEFFNGEFWNSGPSDSLEKQKVFIWMQREATRMWGNLVDLVENPENNPYSPEFWSQLDPETKEYAESMEIVSIDGSNIKYDQERYILLRDLK